MTSVSLGVYNPSSYDRGGVVVVPWDDIRRVAPLDPETTVVFDGNQPLRTQVDRIDPDDRSRDELVFALHRKVAEGTDDYQRLGATFTVKAGTPEQGSLVAHQEATGAKLRTLDNEFQVWVNTSQDRELHGTWFGGSITSVQKGPIDLLDSAAHFKHHDPRVNKRVQVDRIRLFNSPLDTSSPWHDEFVFRTPWTTIAVAHGPVRATATIRSTPFPYTSKDVDGREQTFNCAVYRTFSIYAGDDRIFETICVRRLDDQQKSNAYLWFSARYFMLMRLALADEIGSYRYPSLPGWFSIASKKYPYAGYGFATNAHAGPIWNPPLDYQDDDEDSEDDAFMWELGASRLALAIHVFGVRTSERRLADAAGAAWHDHAYRPLAAAVLS